MKIVEQGLFAEHPQPVYCEDGICLMDDAVLVIDGITVKRHGLAWNEKYGGRLAMEVLREAFRNCHSRKDPAGLVEELNQALAFYNQGRDSNDQMKASILLYSEVSHQVISYGNCPCLLAGVPHQQTNVWLARYAARRAEILKQALQDGHTVEELLQDDPGRQAIHQDLHELEVHENTPDGFAVLNGRHLHAPFLQTWQVQAGEEIVLGTDGWPQLCGSLAETQKRYEETLQKDPLCIDLWPLAKGPLPGNTRVDDAAYVRIICA